MAPKTHYKKGQKIAIKALQKERDNKHIKDSWPANKRLELERHQTTNKTNKEKAKDRLSY